MGRRRRRFARVYLDPAVVRRIKRMAIKFGCQPHDLFVEGVELMMRKYGQPSTAEIADKKWPVREKAQPTRRIITP